jgi:hypothetical protein
MPLLLRSVGRHQHVCRVVGSCARSRGCLLTVPTLGMASKGRLSKAPISEMSTDVLVCVTVMGAVLVEALLHTISKPSRRRRSGSER